METKDCPMTEDFYAEEDLGMFSTALKAHLTLMDEYARQLAEASADLESAIADGDLAVASSVVPAIESAYEHLFYNVMDAERVFSQDPDWALARAERKLAQYSLKVFEASERECEEEE